MSGSQAADAEAAIAAYRGAMATLDLASAEPGKGWDKAIREYMADPAAIQSLSDLAADAADSIRTVGRIHVDTKVTGVYPQTVILEGCADTTDTKILDKSGTNIKAPNQKGSYWRFKQTVKVDNLTGLGWRVDVLKSDVNTTC